MQRSGNSVLFFPRLSTSSGAFGVTLPAQARGIVITGCFTPIFRPVWSESPLLVTTKQICREQVGNGR